MQFVFLENGGDGQGKTEGISFDSSVDWNQANILQNQLITARITIDSGRQ